MPAKSTAIDVPFPAQKTGPFGNATHPKGGDNDDEFAKSVMAGAFGRRAL